MPHIQPEIDSTHPQAEDVTSSHANAGISYSQPDHTKAASSCLYTGI